MAIATGSAAIERHYVDYFGDQTMLLAQQMSSRLRQYVAFQENVFGRSAEIMRQYGQVEANLVTTRYGDTPEDFVSREARWVNPYDFDIATPIDKFDILRLKDSQENVGRIVDAHAAGHGRRMDDVIIERALGNNKTGEDGTTVTAFDTTNQAIAAGATGMTISKLRGIRETFYKNDIDLDNVTICMAITPEQNTNLLESTEITSSDYNAIKALVNGEVDTFMGIKFIISNRLPGAGNYTPVSETITPGAGEQYAVAWVPDGIGLGLWKERTVDIYQRRDKRSNWEAYSCFSYDATRLEEKRVVRVATVQS